jgi:hypothetical protein
VLWLLMPALLYVLRVLAVQSVTETCNVTSHLPLFRIINRNKKTHVTSGFKLEILHIIFFLFLNLRMGTYGI